MTSKGASNKVAGVSDEAVRAKTGRGWQEWFQILDDAGAMSMSHPQMARHLKDDHGVPDWWCQMVANGYERARGLRAKHQMPQGYQISVSKTMKAPVQSLYEAWESASLRKRWLGEEGLVSRRASPHKSLRLTWIDGKTSVEVSLNSKGDSKTQVMVQHSKLPNAQEADEMKAYWKEALHCLEQAV